jgi:hypothetical protein
MLFAFVLCFAMQADAQTKKSCSTCTVPAKSPEWETVFKVVCITEAPADLATPPNLAVVRIEASQIGNLWYAEVFNVDGVLLHTTPLFGNERTAMLAARFWSDNDSPAIPDCECGPCKCDVCECTLTAKAEANCCTQRNQVQTTLMHRQPIRVVFVRVFHRRCR